MRQCTNLVESYKKNGSKYVKSQIRKHEKINNPNILEQWQLCQDYINLCHTENIESEIYELCKNCKYNVNDKVVDEMHNGKYEIIWGDVYLKEPKNIEEKL